MARNDQDKGSVRPSEQRGGTTPDEAEAREKGSWAGAASDGIVPAEPGGSDAPREMLAEDPQLGSAVLGKTTGSDEPATEDGVDLSGGDDADATSDGGQTDRKVSSPTSRTLRPRVSIPTRTHQASLSVRCIRATRVAGQLDSRADG